jgi:hypothetical protein
MTNRTRTAAPVDYDPAAALEDAVASLHHWREGLAAAEKAARTLVAEATDAGLDVDMIAAFANTSTDTIRGLL